MTSRFNDDDLIDYDDEEYYEEDEEAEDDKVEYAVIGASSPKNKQTKPAPVAAAVVKSVRSSSFNESFRVNSEHVPSCPGFSASLIQKMKEAKGSESRELSTRYWAHTVQPNSFPACPSTHSDQVVVVVIGHVDAGKSTLNARLVRAFGTPEESKRPKQLAWELDVGSDERERGVTIDAKSKSLIIANRPFTVIDAPGHRDFVPSMLLGAMQADAAVLVVDGIKFDSGFSQNGQTREHLSLIRALGIHQLIVVINKVDQISVDTRKDDLATIRSQLEDYLFDEIFFQKKNVQFLTISALVDPDLKELEEALLKCKSTKTEFCHSVCVPVADVSEKKLSGRIECGSIQSGEILRVLPGNHLVRLSVSASSGAYLESVHYDLLTEGTISAGNVLVDPIFPLRNMSVETSVFAQLMVLNDDVMPMVRGQQVTLNCHTVAVPAVVARILPNDAGKVPKCLVKGDKAIVELRVKNGIVVESDTHRVTGRIILRDRGITVAAGLITRILPAS